MIDLQTYTPAAPVGPALVNSPHLQCLMAVLTLQVYMAPPPAPSLQPQWSQHVPGAPPRPPGSTGHLAQMGQGMCAANASRFSS